VIRTVLNQNGEALPIVALEPNLGSIVTITAGESSSTPPLAAGAYLVNVSAPAIVRIAADGGAGDTVPGSFFVNAGAGAYFLVASGQRVHARATDAEGRLFVVPVKNS
jgi:hypothetical protein